MSAPRLAGTPAPAAAARWTDAELLARLDDDDSDAATRRLFVGPTFEELAAEREGIGPRFVLDADPEVTR